MPRLELHPGALTIAELRALWGDSHALQLDPAARAGVDRAAATVSSIVAAHRTVYGVNTGFGLLARTRIDDARLIELQRALVLSHSAGTGPLLDDVAVRLVIALKVASLARGHSGVRWAVIETLAELHNRGVVPCIPAQGSVGASGDLAPLADLSSVPPKSHRNALIAPSPARYRLASDHAARRRTASAGAPAPALGQWRWHRPRSRQ